MSLTNAVNFVQQSYNQVFEFLHCESDTGRVVRDLGAVQLASASIMGLGSAALVIKGLAILTFSSNPINFGVLAAIVFCATCGGLTAHDLLQSGVARIQIAKTRADEFFEIDENKILKFKPEKENEFISLTQENTIYFRHLPSLVNGISSYFNEKK